MEQRFPYGRKDTQVARRTDMTKLIVAFRNFANAPKNCNAKTGTKFRVNTIQKFRVNTIQKFRVKQYTNFV